MTIFLILFNLIYIYFFDYFSKKVNIYDTPDKIRKKHKKKIPLAGGILLFTNFLILFFFQLFSDSELFFKHNFQTRYFFFYICYFLIFFYRSL